MRKITFVSAAWLVLLLAFASCEELGRIDQIDENAPAPKAATVTSVTTKPGGAIIHYSIPNDDNILGVKAVFERNGETCESMASRFVDSLVVEGFGDTAERKATVYAVGKNGKLSTGSPVTFTPETPPVQGATVDLEATFGGVRVKLEGNDSNAATCSPPPKTSSSTGADSIPSPSCSASTCATAGGTSPTRSTAAWNRWRKSSSRLRRGSS